MADSSVQATLVQGSDLPSEVRDLLRGAQEFPVPCGGRLYYPLGQDWLVCEDTDGGNSFLSAVARSLNRQAQHIHTLQDAYRFLLFAEDPGQEAALIRRFGIAESKSRCIIVFEQDTAVGQPLYSRLCEIAEGNPGETCTDLTPSTVAFIKTVNPEEPEEPAEFAKAVISMAKEEFGLTLSAGIGCVKSTVFDLAVSRIEAEKAIRTGKQFQLQGPVYSYQRQTLERLLAGIPAEIRHAFQQELVTDDRSWKLFSGENRKMIQAFFENDLNLSTTARMLYMHRNTMSNKLDRIRQETGLDLRSFKDAAVCQILMESADLDPRKPEEEP